MRTKPAGISAVETFSSSEKNLPSALVHLIKRVTNAVHVLSLHPLPPHQFAESAVGVEGLGVDESAFVGE
jgi:hypothetical protein